MQGAIELYKLSSGFSEPFKVLARELDREIGESEDCAEGARAFTEKRRPVWKMR